MSTAELRRMFQEDGIERRAAAGELTIRVLKSHDAKRSLNMPSGTQSQLIAYVDQDGTHIAEAHRYLRPDGILDASGHADPKKLRRGDVIYQPWWGGSMGDRFLAATPEAEEPR
ncbi:MAG: hypothetical protein HYU51_07405 [Candidatus Rokubacteria bacterium]|nr:hypothetical protein [Candidatus Rokubacteria bacterium]